MHDLETSLVVLGTDTLITTSFDRPISVAGKSIGVKSVGFPQIDPIPVLVKYKFRVLDSTGNIHTLKLRANKWETSDQLIQAMFGEINNLFDKLDLGNQEKFYFGDVVPEIIEKPLFFKNVGMDLLTVIYYGSSGLKIKDDGDSLSNDSVFSLLKNRFSSNDDSQFAYSNHFLKQSEDPPLETIVPVFLFCDVIKPTYTGNVKRRILDVVHAPHSETGRSYFTNSSIQFHKFSVDKVLHINFYFQYLDGTVLNFSEPVVIHLMIQ